MQHPLVFAIPVLMLADWFLTLAGAVLRDRRYAAHVTQESYELNPVWRTAVAERRWLNVRHIAVVVLVTALTAFYVELPGVPAAAVAFLFGALFVIQGALIGRHAANILVFVRMSRRPEEMSGKVTMSHAHSLSVSTYQHLSIALPLALLAVLDPTPAVLGGLSGSLALILVHMVWGWRHRRAQRRRDAAAVEA